MLHGDVALRTFQRLHAILHHMMPPSNTPSDLKRSPSKPSGVPSDRLCSRPRRRPFRALVVEDTEDTRELYAAELEVAGFEVARADSGEAGLRLAQEFQPDIILLDLMLPGVNGFSVARAVRAREGKRGKLAILAVTALTSDQSRTTALEAGCDEILCKPVLPSVVVDEARLLLELRDRSKTGGH